MVSGRDLALDKSLFDEPARGKRKGKPVFRGTKGDRVMIASCALAALVLALGVLDKNKGNWVGMVLLGLAFLATELFALPMRREGRLSIAVFPVIIAVMHCGPLGAALIPLFGVPVFYADRGEEGIGRVIFNTAQFVSSAGVAGLLFWHIGGGAIKADLSNGGDLIMPWLVATLAFFLLNTVLVTPLIADTERMFRFWKKRLLGMIPGYILYSGIGFLAAIAYIRLQFTVVALTVAVLIAMRMVYTRYGRMRTVCDDTTLAIMEAVESGDVFYQGHSTGVADVAVAIAEEMNYHEEDLHLVRQAALLHDVGRLTLESALVHKPEEYTPEDYEAMKKHPLVGSSIVSKENSFAVVAPLIAHHHEAVDGSGYPDGIAGDSIPESARILAVADAFDAMLRPAAYREGMDPYSAASEIIRSKGIQFDPDVVDAFTRVVMKRGVWTGARTEGFDERPVVAEQPRLSDEAQPTLEEVVADKTPGAGAAAGATPAEGIPFTEVRSEIEKDITDWKRSEGERFRRRARGERRGTVNPFKGKRGKEQKGS